jgi:adenine phosphoribosyltransferase
MPIASFIRTIPDHPKPGILFRDITTLLKDPQGLRLAIDRLVARYVGTGITKVAAVEARGFIIGAPVAHALGAGFVPVRKMGKLPWSTLGRDYELEYGVDRVEIHTDAIAPGEKVLIVDDLIATGGTAEAAASLITEAGGSVVGCAFVIDLPDLGGSERLRRLGYNVFSLCEFEGH